MRERHVQQRQAAHRVASRVAHEEGEQHALDGHQEEAFGVERLPAPQHHSTVARPPPSAKVVAQ